MRRIAIIASLLMMACGAGATAPKDEPLPKPTLTVEACSPQQYRATVTWNVPTNVVWNSVITVNGYDMASRSSLIGSAETSSPCALVRGDIVSAWVMTTAPNYGIEAKTTVLQVN